MQETRDWHCQSTLRPNWRLALHTKGCPPYSLALSHSSLSHPGPADDHCSGGGGHTSPSLCLAHSYTYRFTICLMRWQRLGTGLERASHLFASATGDSLLAATMTTCTVARHVGWKSPMARISTAEGTTPTFWWPLAEGTSWNGCVSGTPTHLCGAWQWIQHSSVQTLTTV